MKTLRTAAIVLLLLAPTVAQTPQLNVAAAGATSVPTSPWDPLISFIGALWNHWKGSKSEKDNAQKELQASISNMDQSITQIQDLPDLMFDSRDFREHSIQFAQLLATLSKNKAADSAWGEFTQKKKITRDYYDKIYGDKSKYLNTLRLDPNFFSVDHDAKAAWEDIDTLLADNPKDADTRQKAIDQIVSNKDGETISKAGLLPDWLATTQVNAIVGRYKQVAAQAKKNQAPQKSDAQSTSESARNDRSQLKLVSWQSQPEQSAGANSSNENKVSREKELGQLESFNKAPDWITGTLAETRSQYKTNWLETLLAGLVGACFGFGGLMMATVISRSRLTPKGTEQLDLLSRSLSFRADAGKEVASELAALHLDVSKYILSREDAPVSPEKAQSARKAIRTETSHDSEAVKYEESLKRIQEFREKLKKANLIS